MEWMWEVPTFGSQNTNANNNINNNNTSYLIQSEDVPKLNAREIAEAFFDAFFQVDLDSQDLLFKDLVWALGWFAVGQNFLSLQSWLGKLLRSRVLEEKKRIKEENPTFTDKFLKDEAEKWLSAKEKSLRSTKEGRKTVYFITIKFFDGNNPSNALKKLATATRKDLKEFILLETDLKDVLNNFKVNSKGELKQKLKKRKKEKIEPIGSDENTRMDYATIPFVQVFETPTHFKILTHTPFLSTNGIKHEIISTTAIKFSGIVNVPKYNADEILFTSGWIKNGTFERNIVLPNAFDGKTILKSGSGNDFIFMIQKTHK